MTRIQLFLLTVGPAIALWIVQRMYHPPSGVLVWGAAVMVAFWLGLLVAMVIYRSGGRP